LGTVTAELFTQQMLSAVRNAQTQAHFKKLDDDDDDDALPDAEPTSKQ